VAESLFEWFLTAGWFRVTEFLLLLFALVLVPYFYVRYRKEKYRGSEGDYPELSTRPLTWDSDPGESRRPTASVAGSGRVDTESSNYLSYLIYKYSWRHPDVQRYQKYLKKKRDKTRED